MAKAKKTPTSKATTRPAKKKTTRKKAPSTKRKASPATKKKVAAKKKAPTKKSNAVSDEITEDSVTLDRRKADRRDEKTTEAPTAKQSKLERREKVNRRRQIDPTTCERDYTEEEVEFMNAMELYKRRSGRMFPTCSEVLEVLRGMGYVRRSELEGDVVMPDPASDSATTPVAPLVANHYEMEQAGATN